MLNIPEATAEQVGVKDSGVKGSNSISSFLTKKHETVQHESNTSHFF